VPAAILGPTTQETDATGLVLRFLPRLPLAPAPMDRRLGGVHGPGRYFDSLTM
jgi:hypothetical protein